MTTSFETLGVSWPPRGWRQFESIQTPCGQAILKQPVSGVVCGLRYMIEPVPIYSKKQQKSLLFHVQITGWEYSISNQSHEYPVLSYALQERGDDTQCKPKLYISQIKSQGQAIRTTSKSARRCLMASVFLIQQINKGNVPDIEKTLKIYRIHTSQKQGYEMNLTRTDSLYCGLPHTHQDDVGS